MSGPKIIDTAARRAVERTRLLSLCARLDIALRRCNGAIDTLPASARFEFERVEGGAVEELRAAAESDRLAVLQSARRQAKALLAEVKSLGRDAESARLDQKASDQANRLALQEMASGLQQRAGDRPEVNQLLARAAGAGDAAEQARLLEQASALLGEVDEAETTSAASQEWLAEIGAGGSQKMQAPLSRFQREAARWLGELEVFAADEAEIFRARVAALGDMPEAGRALMTDSLRIELGERARFVRRVDARRIALEEWQVVVAGCDAAAGGAGLLSSLEAAVESDGDEFEKLEKKTDAWYEQQLERLSAERAREAILEALDSLGYEVREGMERAWSENGRLYVQKPEAQGYAVELVTLPADEARMRTRLVRYGQGAAATPDEQQRDVEAEESWCQDHAAMVEHLRSEEIEVAVKVARVAGEVPLGVAQEGEGPAEDRRRGGAKGRESEMR